MSGPAGRWVEAVRQRFAAARARGVFADARAASGRSRSAIRRAVLTAAAMVLGGNASLLACPVCFGAEETALLDGTRLGILVLLGITIAVQGGFVAFFIYLRRRAKRAADIELDAEWAELQRPSRT